MEAPVGICFWRDRRGLREELLFAPSGETTSTGGVLGSFTRRKVPPGELLINFLNKRISKATNSEEEVPQHSFAVPFGKEGTWENLSPSFVELALFAGALCLLVKKQWRRISPSLKRRLPRDFLAHLQHTGFIRFGAGEFTFLPSLREAKTAQGVFELVSTKKEGPGPLDVLNLVWLGEEPKGIDPPRLFLVAEEGRDGLCAQVSCLLHLYIAELYVLLIWGKGILRLCPNCLLFHREKGHFVCNKCRSASNREKRQDKPKTDEARFRNKVSQNVGRKNLTPEQALYLKDVLKKQGLETAQREYLRLKEENKGRK